MSASVGSAFAQRTTEAPELDCDLTIPLVLDLDGSLLRTDTLHESLLLHLKRDFKNSWRIPFWMLRGRPFLKEQLTTLVTDDDVAGFPFNAELRAFAEHEAELGREIVLATAADRGLAEMVRKRFPFISKTIASDGCTNLKGYTKAEELLRLYPNGFIYAGDSVHDIQVWRHSSGAIFAGTSPALLRKASEVTSIIASFPRPLFGLSGLRRALRLHQWAKNALIFVPLMLGGKALDAAAWTRSLEAFLAFSILASGTYLLNDLWDLHEDRQHWSKKCRPLAAGELPIWGISLAAAAGLLSFGAAFTLGSGCVAIMVIYLFVSLLYSFRLKREPIIDVFILASLFSMRLALGVEVTGVAYSSWLFVFSMFLFLSLSTAKRQTEIARMVDFGHQNMRGRGYRAGDGPFVLGLGLSSMVATVLIMVIYLIEDAFPAGMYKHPQFLWGFPVVLFLWLARIWLLCHRNELHDDPVAFAVRDRLSLLYGAAMLTIFSAAVL